MKGERGLTPDMLRQILRYEPETGKIFWLERSAAITPDDKKRRMLNTRFAGKEAFNIQHTCGYLRGMLFAKNYFAHRVAYALYHGAWPDGQVDHINGIKTDNRIENLRCVTRAENARNCFRASNSTTGFTGVVWDKEKGKWSARISVDGTYKNLGSFSDINAAIEARKAANIKYGFSERHGEPRHG